MILSLESFSEKSFCLVEKLAHFFGHAVLHIRVRFNHQIFIIVKQSCLGEISVDSAWNWEREAGGQLSVSDLGEGARKGLGLRVDLLDVDIGQEVDLHVGDGKCHV